MYGTLLPLVLNLIAMRFKARSSSHRLILRLLRLSEWTGCASWSFVTPEFPADLSDFDRLSLSDALEVVAASWDWTDGTPAEGGICRSTGIRCYHTWTR